MMDKKPELKWINLTQLYIPTEYQRSVKGDASHKNINHIKNNFTWAECGALIVSPLAKAKPPQYAVIDGQHRLRAAEARGDISELPCVVISEKQVKDQANNFVNINSKRVSLHILHKYHAAVVAGEPNAVALAAVLKKANIAVAAHAFSSNETPARVTQAVGTLLKLTEDYSEKQIVWVLTIIPDAYGEMRGMLRPNLIRALAQLIKERPDLDRETMIGALRRIDVENLQRDAKAYRSISGGSMRDAFVRVIEKKYNGAKRAA